MIDEVMRKIDSDTRPFWEGTLEHKLFIQQCTECHEHQFYPRIICRNCMGNVEWKQAKGKGEIYSITKIEHAFSERFKNKTPYIVALIKLDEGPSLMTNIVNSDIDHITIGASVTAVFNEVYGEYNLLQFQLS